MEARRFDTVAKAFGSGTTRRRVLACSAGSGREWAIFARAHETLLAAFSRFLRSRAAPLRRRLLVSRGPMLLSLSGSRSAGIGRCRHLSECSLLPLR